MGQGSGYLLYIILDRAIDSYFPVLNKILSLMDDIEDSVFDEGVEVGKEVSILRRDIITQRRVMFPTRTLFAELEPKLKRHTKIDLTLYFSDLMDHMNKICDTLDEYEEVIEVYKDADSVLSDYRANSGIRILVTLLRHRPAVRRRDRRAPVAAHHDIGTAQWPLPGHWRRSLS